MPYTIRVEGNVITFRPHGTVTSEDLRRSLMDVEAIEAAYERTPDRITDLSACDTALWSFDVIEELAARRRAAQLKNTVRSAIYAPTDLQFGFSRMFQILNDNPRIQVEVFRDLAEAEAWLGNGNGSTF